MAHATGIGGFFFRARDPQALGAWYDRYFGITAAHAPWVQDAGMTVFTPFPQDSAYFPADRSFMINLRVDDLPGIVALLTADGIAVETRDKWDGDGSYGHFARIHDPEGNPVELWQPPKE